MAKPRVLFRRACCCVCIACHITSVSVVPHCFCHCIPCALCVIRNHSSVLYGSCFYLRWWRGGGKTRRFTSRGGKGVRFRRLLACAGIRHPALFLWRVNVCQCRLCGKQLTLLDFQFDGVVLRSAKLRQSVAVALGERASATGTRGLGVGAGVTGSFRAGRVGKCGGRRNVAQLYPGRDAVTWWWWWR